MFSIKVSARCVKVIRHFLLPRPRRLVAPNCLKCNENAGAIPLLGNPLHRFAASLRYNSAHRETATTEGDSMEPDYPFMPQDQPTSKIAPELGLQPETPASPPEPQKFARLRRVFLGPQGLRAGWSVLLFIFLSAIILTALALGIATFAGMKQHAKPTTLSPFPALASEAIKVIAILIAGFVMARIERRRLADYYLAGQHRFTHFLGGLAAGFLALSALVGALAWGHWLHFGPVALSGWRILGFAAIWAIVFILTGLFEEGSFRCYLQFTLTRGINFWWALGIVAALCLSGALRTHADGIGGVYVIALLGLVPCLVLYLKRNARAGFWHAAWATSTFFGFVHTGNNGETWIGIFSAAAIGFVFCVSIWVTGSAWWAIGCHASWDWAETYFYGTADSGLIAKGHLLTTSPAGNAFWSGGTTGPEGSVLILGVLVLLLAALLLIYGRKSALPDPSQAPAQLTS